MKLVMVHGRGQARWKPQLLRQEWLQALANGLAAGKLKLPESVLMEFPFYGDELERLLRQVRTAVMDEEELAFRAEVLMEIATGAGLSEEDIRREFELAPRDKGILNWRWVHAILRALDRIPGLSSELIDLFTRDVFAYLRIPMVQRGIDRIVEAALQSGPCVVVAHSLGTIVTYNVLRAEPASFRCARFVTVGSPLGVKAIKRHLPQPLISPPCVAHWFNALDRRDVVALYPLDASNFDVRPPIENKTDVQNRTENRHGISGYLEDPVVAGKVIEFL